MSMHYDLACLDCGVEAGIEHDTACRDSAALHHIVVHIKIFAELADFSFSSVNIGGGRIDTSWLKEHQDHKVQVLSNYETVEGARKRLGL